MLFNFHLRPLEQIVPWGSGNDLRLNWFGLTDGCYWMQAGNAELFRYREEILEAHKYDNYHCEPYVDYQVVRLWEDILDILPSVLAPVPHPLGKILGSPNLLAWRARVVVWEEAKENAFDTPTYEYATEWIRKRHLKSGHLVAGPRIWIWNDGVHIHLEWDNRECQIEGMPVWAAHLGSWTLRTEDFLGQVRMFHTGLMQAMQTRVDHIQLGWNRPDIYIDIDKLVSEQADRSTWLDQALARVDQEDWRNILDVVAQINADTTA